MNSEQNRLLESYRNKLGKPRMSKNDLFIYTFNFKSEKHGTVEIIDLDSNRVYNGLFMLHLDEKYKVSLTIESFDKAFKNPLTNKNASSLYFNIDVFIEQLTKGLILPQSL